MSELTVTESTNKWVARWDFVKRLLTFRRMYHCWADGRDEEFNGWTCMRLAGHFGRHDFALDSDVYVQFPTEAQR